MTELCPRCGRVILGGDKRRKYCSAECAKLTRLHQQARRTQATRTASRAEWARQEAEKIGEMYRERGVDCLANYVFLNYKRK